MFNLSEQTHKIFSGIRCEILQKSKGGFSLTIEHIDKNKPLTISTQDGFYWKV